jgi:hypothetical protein
MISFKNFLDKLHEEAGTKIDDSFFDHPDTFEAYKSYAPKFRVADKDSEVTTLEGSQNYKKGDYIAIGPDEEEYPVKQEKFNSMYDIVSHPEGDKPGTTKLKGEPVIKKVRRYDGEPTTFTPPWEGAKPYNITKGYYLVQHGKGDIGPVEGSIFDRTYTRVKK